MDLNALKNNPEQIAQLISLLQSLLPEDQPTNAETPPGNKYQLKKKAPSTNKFESMREFSMHKEDTVIDKALSKHPPVARNREYEEIEATCRICGKTEKVNPDLILEGRSRYKCNNCATQAG